MTNPPSALEESPAAPALPLWKVHSAVDLNTDTPIVVVQLGSEDALVPADFARGISVQCATAAAGSEAEVAYVRLLRSKGIDGEDELRRELAALYLSYERL
ncbi:hypothetical protein [Actinopolymorpha pittospori]|uniref:Uncharacterized protein n=1 Tax=Actinopolymorpha pittospori TaxID=648752 RepID=A0A927RDG8_9ACTN|nr:hypothetical protein [Actinopolymorpha pittospori]MBE1608130.1 hypothetical protein [Actinopolymorpha pittospori]